MKTKPAIFLTTAIIFSLLIGACGAGESEATPTLDPGAIHTIAVATFSAGLTQTALFMPTKTATTIPTATQLFSSPTLSNITPFGTSSGALPNATASCYRMSYVADVTIPDNTPMTPGQAFTKTWKVRNTGSCAWEVGFKFAFTSGDAMSGATYTLPQSVPANTEIDISIAMTAPTNKTGSVRGNWRMSTAAGAFFGDEVYLVILVGGAAGTSTATKTNTSAASTTAAPTATATETPTATTTSP